MNRCASLSAVNLSVTTSIPHGTCAMSPNDELAAWPADINKYDHAVLDMSLTHPE